MSYDIVTICVIGDMLIVWSGLFKYVRPSEDKADTHNPFQILRARICFHKFQLGLSRLRSRMSKRRSV